MKKNIIILWVVIVLVCSYFSSIFSYYFFGILEYFTNIYISHILILLPLIIIAYYTWTKLRKSKITPRPKRLPNMIKLLLVYGFFSIMPLGIAILYTYCINDSIAEICYASAFETVVNTIALILYLFLTIFFFRELNKMNKLTSNHIS